MSGPPGPILAVDASTLAASVALLGPAGELGRWDQPDGVRGTAALAAGVGRVLADAGLSVADLAGVVVGTGPGSYTGLRAAIAFARGLVQPSGLPLVGVPSVAGAALAALRARPELQTIVTVLDARRGECYRADHRRVPGADDQLATMRAPCLVPDTEITALLQDPPPGLLVVREPWIDAADLALLGRARVAGGGDDPARILPLYLKRSHAEIALRERAQGD